MRGHGDKWAQCVGAEELSSVKGQWAGFLPDCLVPRHFTAEAICEQRPEWGKEAA